jgi:hypothetical protein
VLLGSRLAKAVDATIETTVIAARVRRMFFMAESPC